MNCFHSHLYCGPGAGFVFTRRVRIRSITSLFTLLLLTIVSFIGCKNKSNQPNNKPEPPIAQYQPDLVYGDDHRKDLFEVEDTRLLARASSTVALVRASKVSLGAVTSKIHTKSFQEVYGLCSSEPFYTQQLGAFCSGFLVAPDLIATAGHCISSSYDCSNTLFVFDYAMDSLNDDPTVVASNNVYGCSEIIATKVMPAGADYALVKLNRPVQDRSPLNLRSSGQISAGAPLVVIGHPVGLPTKVAGGANIRSVKSEYFVANLDTYGGNSGSAVFNATSGDVEGILVRGDTDFVTQGSCVVSNQCNDNDCRGEAVTKIQSIVELLPEAIAISPEPELQEVAVESIPNLLIPDNSPYGATDYIKLTEAMQGRELLIEVNIEHTWRGDLVVELISPSYKIKKLHDRSGYRSNNIRGTYGVDFLAVDSIGDLKNEPAGNWLLRVKDLAKQDTGTLKSWKLTIK